MNDSIFEDLHVDEYPMFPDQLKLLLPAHQVHRPPDLNSKPRLENAWDGVDEDEEAFEQSLLQVGVVVQVDPPSVDYYVLRALGWHVTEVGIVVRGTAPREICHRRKFVDHRDSLVRSPPRQALYKWSDCPNE